MNRQITTKTAPALPPAANPATVAMMEVFAGSIQAYNQAQFDGGIAYLEATYSGYMAQQLATSKHFWAWWGMHWAGRDELWERYCRSQGLYHPALITASYHQFHTLHLPYYNGYLSPSARPTNG